MNKTFYTQENIDAYLTNRLSREEMRVFENGLEKDPLLKGEIGLQREIIESIKQSRRLELKSRLNNIEIGGATSTGYAAYKIAASLLVTGLLSSGIYFYVNNKSDISDKKGNSLNTAPVNVSKNANNSLKNNELIVSSENRPTVSRGSKHIDQHTSDETPSDRSALNIEDNPKEIKSPEIKESFEDAEFHADNNFDAPEGTVVKDDEGHISDLEVSIQPKGKNNFHYQFYSNKLYLYCDFTAKPYELLELNTSKSKRLYLHFSNAYYELKSSQIEIAPLKMIKDPRLIQQLDAIKDK